MNVLTEKLNKGILIFDGAFGTELMRRKIQAGTVPELINLTAPEVVYSVHRDYIAAGADVISTDTFGANRFKAGEKSEEIIAAAVSTAKKAAEKRALVALDLGPTGQMSEPMGDTSFEEFYECYKAAVIAGKGADLVLLETMSDLTETRAAALAVKENSDLPLIVSMTFGENMRTFTGTPVDAFVYSVRSYADVIGVNCSLGPKQLLPVVERILSLSDKPVIVQANAGLPDSNGNYNVSPEEFAEYAEIFRQKGVSVIGGCCGTTPEHIAAIRSVIGRENLFKPASPPPAVSSATRVVYLDGVTVVGERINPTGKKAMKEALRSGDMQYVTDRAVEQEDAGAKILDVNCGIPEIDEAETLVKLVRHLESVTDLPLQLDSSDPVALEKALRRYSGRAVVNSVNGEPSSLNRILPLVKKYGSMVIGLTIDENGIPKTAEKRIGIAEKIITEAAKYSIPESDIIIDCLTLTAGAEQDQAVNTLEAIRRLKATHSVKTALGISNISFGLPYRQAINSGFLTAALWAGLDLAIINPNIRENTECIDVFNVLTARDEGAKTYTEKYSGVSPTNVDVPKKAASSAEADGDLFYLIKRGLPAENATDKLLDEGLSAEHVIEKILIPALNEVGAAYEKGTLFLPQLIASADSAKSAFKAIKRRMKSGSAVSKGKVVMATVKGDVHDIGKNIAVTVLQNYGYDVIDLGKNVPPEDVVDAVKKHGAKLVGLSALMTTTVKNMEETIRLLKRECPEVKIMVGGAVLTKEYAEKIGADYYCPDAQSDVKIASTVYGDKP